MTVKIPCTVVVPILNEERNLPRCLASVSNFAQVVVADSGSQDNSEAIASEYGAVILRFSWDGGFPKKRNWVLRTFSFITDWVLFLDADEEITPAFERAFSEKIREAGYDGIWLRYDNFFQGKKLKFGLPQKKLAAFKVGKGVYERIEEKRWSSLDMEVHEHPIITGRVGYLSEPVLHHDYNGIDRFLKRHDGYADWEVGRYLALRGCPENWALLTYRQKVKYLFLYQGWFWFAYFVYTYVIRGGFIDGGAGFHYAFLKGVYFHRIYLKLSEAHKGRA
jgi:glycosyltransferase involved in cell wall biosynthesis